MYLLDGAPFIPDRPFTHDGIKYPANWFSLATPEERQAIGITEVPDPPYYDPRFYYGYDDQGNLIPQDHSLLVPVWTETTKNTANGLLVPCDWYIVREQDNGTAVPSGVKEWRQEVRYACEAKILAIESTTTTDELATYINYVTPPSGAATDYSYWPPKTF